MNTFRLASFGAVVASGLLLSACGTSTPMVGSERATPQDLVTDLQSVGVCPGEVEFVEASGLLSVGDGVLATRCDGSYAVTFFPPGDGITTVFSPLVCEAGISDQPETQIVWGMNWFVSALNGQAERKLGDVADATMGSQTTTEAMYAEFCTALEG